MTANLRSYLSYRPSGVEWLGDIPAHWEVTAVKKRYAIQLGKMLQNRPNSPDDVEVPYLKAQYVQWFHVRTTGAPKMWASQNDTDQFGIAPGDLLVCEGGEGGRCGILKQKVSGYIIQNALHRVRPRDQSRNDFLQYVMSAIAATGWFDALNDKATIAHFTKEKFGALRAPLPPLSEQAAIVRYLDHVDERIRRYVSGKQKLIRLLEEEKQAVIHRAVTRGLDPNVRLKPSGVEWLGDIPAHWEVTAVKKRYAIQLGKMLQNRPNNPDDVEVSYLKAQHVQWFHVRTIDAPKMWASQNDTDQFGIAPGDLLVCEGGEGGRCGILKQKVSGYIIQNALHRVRPRDQSRNDFLQYVMSAIAATGWFDALNDKATIAHFTKEKFGALRAPLPPLPEQTAIVRYLDKATAAIDTAIDRARRQIELLQEYRTRLIADVVTGQVDVRAAGGQVP